MMYFLSDFTVRNLMYVFLIHWFTVGRHTSHTQTHTLEDFMSMLAVNCYCLTRTCYPEHCRCLANNDLHLLNVYLCSWNNTFCPSSLGILQSKAVNIPVLQESKKCRKENLLIQFYLSRVYSSWKFRKLCFTPRSVKLLHSSQNNTQPQH